MKDILAFASYTVKTDFPQMGEEALALEMPFDEKTVLDQCVDFIKKDCQLEEVNVFHAEDADAPDAGNRKKDAKPGKPAFYTYSE